jgi:hypothetical protein
MIPTPTDANGVQSFKLDAANGGGTTTARSCVAQRSDLVQRLQSR